MQHFIFRFIYIVLLGNLGYSLLHNSLFPVSRSSSSAFSSRNQNILRSLHASPMAGILSSNHKIHSSFMRLNMAPSVFSKTMRVHSDRLVSAMTSLCVLTVTHLLNLRSSVVIGGILAGSLHAVTGPDHIAALLPSSVGQRWFTGMRIGAAWGLGHGFSAMLMGLFAFLLKDKIKSQFAVVEKLSSVAESAVGVSLLLIGALGLKEALFDAKPDSDEAEPRISSLKSNTAIFSNGVLHGFSWDGAPSLAPALTLSSWRSVVFFLLSYCFGTMLAMSATAGAVGEGSIRLGEATKNPELPQKLSIISSVVAIFIGLFWIVQAMQ